MTTTIVGRTVGCSGRNHSDHGTFVECPKCGVLVIRGAKGQLSQPVGHSGRRFYCWTAHECSTLMVEWYGIEQARAVAEGGVARGTVVEVVKGRKVPLGTVGIVRVVDTEGQFGARVALSVEGEERLVWTALSNVAVTDAEVIAEAKATVAAYDAKHEAWATRLAELVAEQETLGAARRAIFASAETMNAEERAAAWVDHVEADLTANMERETEVAAAIVAIKTERGY